VTPLPTLTTGGASYFGVYRANELSLADGDPVATWVDTSPAAKNVTAVGAARPTYRANGWPGGKPCVSFAAGNILQAASAADWKFLSDGSGYTVFVVWRTTDAPGLTREYGLWSTQEGDTTRVGSYGLYNSGGADTDKLYFVQYRGVGDTEVFHCNANNAAPTRVIYNHCFQFDGSNASLFNWGSSLATAALSASASSSNPEGALTIGDLVGGGLSLNGDIAAVVICKGALNAADLAAVNATLEADYKIGGNTAAEFFFDTANIAALSGATHTKGLTLTKDAGNPLLSGLSDPDHDLIYATVLKFSSTDYRAWAGVFDSTGNIGNSAYYTSSDGRSWTRPALHQVAFGGNTNNNLFGTAGEYMTGLLYNATGATGRKYLRVLDSDIASGENQVVILQGSEDGITGWSDLKDLTSAVPVGSEGGFPVLRSDGRIAIIYEGEAGVGNRTLRMIVSDTTDVTGTWTDQGAILTPSGTTDQYYQTVICQVGELWLAFALRFDGVSKLVTVDLLASRENGASWSWTVVKANIIPLGSSGTWDDSTIFSANLVQTDPTTWGVYYTGGAEDHETYPRNQALGLATVRYGRLNKIAGTGTVRTLAIYQPAQSIFVNADATGGTLTAALLDASGNVISGYDDANCTAVTSDVADYRLTWSGGNLPSQVARIRFTLTSATLYSFRIAVGHNSLLRDLAPSLTITLPILLN
jgi:hypothetical protein